MMSLDTMTYVFTALYLGSMMLQRLTQHQVSACMSTSSSSGTSTTTCTTTVASSCTAPVGSVGIIVDTANGNIVFLGVPSRGTCPCSNGYTDNFYDSAPGNSATAAADSVGVLTCTNGVSGFCACDATGNCYVPLGTIQNQFFGQPYCDNQGCFFYQVFECPATNYNDPNSGLQQQNSAGTLTGAQITCAQTNPTGTATGFVDIGTNSPWPKVVSVSCNTCLRCQSCTGPFTST